MDKKLLDQIDARIFEKKQQDEKAKIIRSERELKEKDSYALFEKFKETVYKPAFDEFKKNMDERGIKTKIEESGEKIVDKHSTQQAYIGLGILHDDGYKSINEFPHLRLVYDKSNCKVNVFKSTIGPNHGGSSGSDGSYSPELITKELILEKLTKIVCEIL